MPHGAWLVGQRHLRQPLDLLGAGEVLPVHSGLRVGLLHTSVRARLTVGETGGVPVEVLDRDLPLRGHHRVPHFARDRIESLNGDLKLRERREELRDRISEGDLALLDEHHRGDRGDRLRHRVDPEDGVRAHRRAGRLVAEAHGLEVGDSPLPSDQRHGARDLALGDVRLEHLPDPLEPL